MLLWNTDYFELQAQKEKKEKKKGKKKTKYRERLSLNALTLPEDRASMGNPGVLNPSLEVAPTRKIATYQVRRLQLTPHPDTLSQTITPLISSSRGLLIFPKIHPLSPKRPTSSSSFTVNMALKTKFLATLRSYFFPGYLPCVHYVYILNFCLVFSC